MPPSTLPWLWSLAPDLVVQAGTFSKIFAPGVRLGWAVGPAEVVAQLGAANQTTDQCGARCASGSWRSTGATATSSARYPRPASSTARTGAPSSARCVTTCPTACAWSVPTGGFFTWLTLPEHVDTIAMRDAAVEAGVAYVAGRPFYAGEGGRNELRLSFSFLPQDQLGAAAEPLSGVVAGAIAAGR